MWTEGIAPKCPEQDSQEPKGQPIGYDLKQNNCTLSYLIQYLFGLKSQKESLQNPVGLR